MWAVHLKCKITRPPLTVNQLSVVYIFVASSLFSVHASQNINFVKWNLDMMLATSMQYRVEYIQL